MKRVCVRCSDEKEANELGLMFMHFVCLECRHDNEQWHWGHDVTLQAMEYQMPAPHITNAQGGEGRC